MPQSKVVREMERSFSPPRRKLRTSLRGGLGLDVEGAALDEVDEGELVVGEAEEVVLLGDGLGGAAALGQGAPTGTSTKASSETQYWPV